MAQGTVTAATLIAAVLEHQGFMTQARFLAGFQSFFRDAGALIYMLGGAGAVVSVVIFGSFRAPRYLLLGPAIFWFLVGPTTSTEGVLWKLGDGPFRGKLREEGRGAAEATRNEILEKLNQKGNGVNGNIEVAIGFYLFAKPISEFVEAFVGILLKDEARSDLMVTSKTHALELIAQTLPAETGFIQRLEDGLYSNCSRMMTAASSAGWTYVRDGVSAGLGGSKSQLPELQKAREQQLKDVVRFGEDHLPVKGSGFDELIRAHIQSGTGAFPGTLKKSNNEPLDHISCAVAWRLVAEELWHSAGRAIPRIIRVATNEADYQKSKDYACKELTLKAVTEGGDICNLRPAVALAILHRHMTRADTFGRIMERHWNKSVHTNPSQNISFTSAAGGEWKAWVSEAGRIAVQKGRNAIGSISNSVLMGGRNRVLDDKKTVETTHLWAPQANLSVLYGQEDAMWVGTRQHETMRLRGEIYTWALNLPYFQGICLYLVTVAYPFLALVVLLPGRAIHFVNVPLAYLWIKSWDIGLAAVIILDKIMYNLLPSREVSEELLQGPWSDLSKLPIAMSEAYMFDPMGSIHIYYVVISLAWLSIPAVTGAATIGARKSVLSSFVDGATAQAKDGGERQASAFSIAAQNQRTVMMKEIQGFGKKLPTLGDGVNSGAAAMSADAIARVAGAVRGADKGFNPSSWKKGRIPEGVVNALPEGAKHYIGTYSGVIGVETNLSSALIGAHDKTIGRWGTMGMMLDAYTSAMDGGGGYEMNDHYANATDELIKAYTHKVGVALDTYGEAAGIFAKGGMSALDFEAKFLTKTGGAVETMFGPSMVALGAELERNSFGEKGMITGLFTPDRTGFTQEEYLARVFHVHPQILSPSGDMQELTDSSKRLLGAYSPLASTDFAPGGASYLDTLLATLGGNRFLTTRTYDTEAQAQAALSAGQAKYSAGPDYVFGAEPQYIEQRKAAIDAFKNEQGQLYEGAVEQRRQFLLGAFGVEAVQEFYQKQGVQLAPATISIDHLTQFAVATDKQYPGEAFYSFNAQALQIAKGSPLLQAELVEDWIARRSGTVNHGAVGTERPTDDLITTSSDLFPTTIPMSAGRTKR